MRPHPDDKGLAFELNCVFPPMAIT